MIETKDKRLVPTLLHRTIKSHTFDMRFTHLAFISCSRAAICKSHEYWQFQLIIKNTNKLIFMHVLQSEQGIPRLFLSSSVTSPFQVCIHIAFNKTCCIPLKSSNHVHELFFWGPRRQIHSTHVGISTVTRVTFLPISGTLFWHISYNNVFQKFNLCIVEPIGMRY